MDYELMGFILGLLVVIFSTIAALLSVAVLVKVHKSKHRPTRHILYVFFGIFSLAFIFWAIAENLYYWPLYLYNLEPFPGPADIFYVVAYLIDFIAFGYLGWYLIRDDNEKGTSIALLSFIAIVLAVVQYLVISRLVLPNLEGNPLAQALDLYYPIASTFFVLLAGVVFLSFRRMRLKTPMILIVLGAISAFGGDFLFSFASAADTYGTLGVIADTLYVFDYGFNSIALLLFYRWLT